MTRETATPTPERDGDARAKGARGAACEANLRELVSLLRARLRIQPREEDGSPLEHVMDQRARACVRSMERRNRRVVDTIRAIEQAPVILRVLHDHAIDLLRVDRARLLV